MANFWQIKKAIIYIFGVIILQQTSSVYAVCPRPTGAEYANTIFEPSMAEYTDNTNVVMTCEPGYTGEGSPSSYCFNGDWVPPPLICNSDCERPGVYDDVTYSPIQDSYTHGSIVTYGCVDAMSDVLGEGQSVCQNGVWDPTPTTANPSCSGIRTVPPTTRPQTSATTSGSTTSNQLPTDATTQSEGTTDTKMTTVTTLEKTEGVPTGSTPTESPTTGESLTQTYAPLTTASFSPTSVSDRITVSGDYTTMSGQTDDDRTVSDSTELPDRSTVSDDFTDQTKRITISEATDLTEVSTVSEATDQTELSTVTDSKDQTDSSTVADNTDGNTVSEITDTTDGRTVSKTTEQTELTTVQTESSTLTDGTEPTHVSTVTGATEPNEDSQTTEPTARMQTENTNTQGTDQPTNEPSPSGSVTGSLATESPGISTATHTEGTQNPTTVTATSESEQTTPEQFSDVTTDSSDTSSTLKPITDFNSQATNDIQTTQDPTDMTDLSTDDASAETTASSHATMTTMPSGSQGMTSALGTGPLESDPTTLSTETFSSQPTDDAITSRQTEAPSMTTQAISDMSTDEIETVSAGTSDETTREPTEGVTSLTDMADGTTVQDLLTSRPKTTVKEETPRQTTSQDLCNGQCDETREICVETSCECQEGFQRPYEESTCEPTTFYSISMTILEIDGVTAILTSDLRTTGSNAFIALQLTICTSVTTLLDGVFIGFKTCSITGFTAGSIIADIRLGLTNTTGVDKAAILDVIMTSELYLTTNSNFTINPSETSVIPTDECELGLDDCSSRADCKDLAENSFTCKCWDGYADYSPDGYDGRNCAAYNWKLIAIVVGSCAGALLLASCVMIVCGGSIIKRCTDRPKVITSGTKPAPKHDVGVTTDDQQDIIPWHHREKDEQIFYAHHVDGQEARRLNTARSVRGSETYDNAESYDLGDYRSSKNDHRSSKTDQEDRYVPIVM